MACNNLYIQHDGYLLKKNYEFHYDFWTIIVRGSSFMAKRIVVSFTSYTARTEFINYELFRTRIEKRGLLVKLGPRRYRHRRLRWRLPSFGAVRCAERFNFRPKQFRSSTDGRPFTNSPKRYAGGTAAIHVRASVTIVTFARRYIRIL